MNDSTRESPIEGENDGSEEKAALVVAIVTTEENTTHRSFSAIAVGEFGGY